MSPSFLHSSPALCALQVCLHSSYIILSTLITCSVCFAVLSCEASSPTRSPLLTGYEPCTLALPTSSSHCQTPPDAFVEGSGLSCVPYTLFSSWLLTASPASFAPTTRLRVPCLADSPLTSWTPLSHPYLHLHQVTRLSVRPIVRYSLFFPNLPISLSAAPQLHFVTVKPQVHRLPCNFTRRQESCPYTRSLNCVRFAPAVAEQSPYQSEVLNSSS